MKTRKGRRGPGSGHSNNTGPGTGATNVEGFIPQLNNNISNKVSRLFGRTIGRIVNRRLTRCMPKRLKDKLENNINNRTEGVVNDLTEKGLTIGENALKAIPFVGSAVSAVSIADTGLAAVRTIGTNTKQMIQEVEQVKKEEEQMRRQILAREQQIKRIQQEQAQFNGSIGMFDSGNTSGYKQQHGGIGPGGFGEKYNAVKIDAAKDSDKTLERLEKTLTEFMYNK